MIVNIEPSATERIDIHQQPTDRTMGIMEPSRSGLLFVDLYTLNNVPQGEGTEDLFTFARRAHLVPRGKHVHLRVRNGAAERQTVSINLSPTGLPSDPLG